MGEYETLQFQRSEKFNRNRDMVTGDQSPCVVCGKGIRPDRQRFVVAVMAAVDDVAIREEDAEMFGIEYGAWPIGDDCRRKARALLAFVYDTDDRRYLVPSRAEIRSSSVRKGRK
jgi:hypothetical protein